MRTRTRAIKRIIFSAVIIGAGTFLWAKDPVKPLAEDDHPGCNICFPGYCNWPNCPKENATEVAFVVPGTVE